MRQLTNNHKKELSIDGIHIKRQVAIPASNVIRRGRGARLDSRPARQVANAYIKITGIALVPLLVFTGLSHIGSTVSYFNEVQTSYNNTFQAGSLFVVLSADADQDTNGTPNVGQETFAVDIDSTSTLPNLYSAKGVLDGGTPSGCSALMLDAWLGSYHYGGPLVGFESPATSTPSAWQFFLTLAQGAVTPGAVCSGAIVFEAGLANAHAGAEHAFNDTKSYTFAIAGPQPPPPPIQNNDASSTQSSTDTSSDQATTTDPTITNDASTTPPVIQVQVQTQDSSSTLDTAPPADTQASSTPDAGSGQSN
jgi:predicted ribosomally synthesized peptide with SipW-like signal peptide